MVLEDCPQPVREHLDPVGPAAAVIDPAVDLGQHSIEDEVVELLFVAHVAVQRSGYHSETCGQGAHGQRVHAVGADDRESLGDHVFAGKCAATALVAGWGDEPQWPRVRIVSGCRLSLRHDHLSTVDCERCSLYCKQCSSEVNVVLLVVFLPGRRAAGPTRCKGG
jgi:hypothetical protein